MKQFLKKISLLILIAVVFCTCKKATSPQAQSTSTNTPTCKYGYLYFNTIDSYLQNHFLFNAGSYWIYKDSVQNVNDSVYCTGSVTQNFSALSACLGNLKVVHNGISDSSYQYCYGLNGNKIAALGTQNNGLYAASFQVMATVDTGDTSFAVSSTVKYLPSCTVGGVLYTNVYRCLCKDKTLNPAFPDSAYKYFKPDVGIVKSEIFFSGQKRVYNLLNYHIQ